jgi:ABC-type multidrug transport system permease subunit
MNSLLPSVLVFIDERPVFLREQSNQMYGVVPYCITKMIVELPILIITPLLMTLVVYFAVGFERTFQ